MADSISSLLQLVLQETGNNNNNWGNILNQTLLRAEEAIAGQSIITVSGGTKALTDDEQRAKVLLITGNLTSDSSIEVKPHLKDWIVLNMTTGNFVVTLRTPSNPQFILARGQSEAIWCDGVTIRSVGENGRVPVGSLVFSFRTVNLPVSEPWEPGFLEANGQAVSRSLYRRLYDVYGTVHGGGDGSTTFNLPNLTGRYVRGRGGNAGSTIGALQDDMVKAHTHTASASTDPGHNHSMSYAVTKVNLSSGSGDRVGGPNNSPDAYTSVAGSHTHTITIVANEGVENRPLSIVGVPLIRYQ